MKATTHAEVYRPFTGELRERPLRPLTLAWSGVRLGLRKKLPAFLLFTPPAITGLVGAIRVYLMYSFGAVAQAEGGLAGLQVTVVLQEMLGNVADNVVLFVKASAYFALLTMTWFGAGMIADDRRMGANLLYFSRPLTRWGYLLGKLIGLMFFGLLTLGIPTFLILGTAILASPDWSFLRFESDVLWKTTLFASTWILTVSLIVLALSSLVNRKTLAITLTFGVIIVAAGVSSAAAGLLEESQLQLLSLPYNFEVYADWLFDQPLSDEAKPMLSLTALGVFTGGGLLLLWHNVRKMEVVG